MCTTPPHSTTPWMNNSGYINRGCTLLSPFIWQLVYVEEWRCVALFLKLYWTLEVQCSYPFFVYLLLTSMSCGSEFLRLTTLYVKYLWYCNLALKDLVWISMHLVAKAIVSLDSFPHLILLQGLNLLEIVILFGIAQIAPSLPTCH